MARNLDLLDIKILQVYAESGEPLRPKDVAAKLGVDVKKIAPKVKKLVAHGYLRYTKRTSRLVYVTITDEGRRLVEEKLKEIMGSTEASGNAE